MLAQRGVLRVAEDTQAALRALAQPGSGLSAQARTQLLPLIASLRADVAKIPRNPPGDNPVTLGVGEPFTTTITVALYFALVISLPLILYELYGFILPALSPSERRVAVPLLTAIPFLFAAGVLFGYFVVLPAAVRFFVNFNSSEFNVLVQASQFYRFAATVLVAMGLIFQVPVAILAATRVGIVTPRQLRKNRRYAIVVCAAVAAFLPGTPSPWSWRPCRCTCSTRRVSCWHRSSSDPGSPEAGRSPIDRLTGAPTVPRIPRRTGCQPQMTKRRQMCRT